MVDQAQSINIFLPADIHKRDLHQIHFQAWKKGVKSLYYCRSLSIQRAETVNSATDISRENVQKAMMLGQKTIEQATQDSMDYEECLSCQ